MKRKINYIFILSISVLLIGCRDSNNDSVSNKADTTETETYTETSAENAVESTSEKVEDAVERAEEPISSKEEKETKMLEGEAFIPSPFIAKILEHLGVQPIQVYEEFIVQKVLPYDTASTVVVIPTVASQDYDWEVFVLNSYILVVDSETAVIKQQFYESKSWYSDAIRIEEVSIDTANYEVADDKRAFGIELYYIGASRPNPYNFRSLSLFIQDRNKLVRVLDSFETHSYWGEWDMKCTGEFIEVNKILIMDPKQSEGFYDIVVRSETTTLNTLERGEDDCDETKTTTKSKQLLRYYGSYKLYQKVYVLETESPCGLKITLEEDRYHIKTNTREQAGTFSIEDGYIIFKALFADEPKTEVQGTYDGEEIVIQNYGNDMNSFTIFEECGDQKYLRLVKKE